MTSEDTGESSSRRESGDEAAGRQSDETRTTAPASGPPTGEVRIAALEAAVAAGLASGDRDNNEPDVPEAGPPTEVYELPDWADPPTGQVPRVLLDDPDADLGLDAVRGPTWREQRTDWEQQGDLSIFGVDQETVVADDTVIAGMLEPEEAPFSFSFEELETRTDVAPKDAESELEAAWAPLLQHEEPTTAEARRRERRRHAARRAHERPRAERPRAERPKSPEKRNAKVATATGVGLAGLVAICLALGAVATLALAALALALVAGEAYGALQRAGYRPATVVGLLTVPALVIAAYLHQGSGIAVVLAVAIVLTALFHLLRPGPEPLVSLSVTLFVALWVGGLGAFAGLLLAPADYPHRHGVVLVLAAVLLTVAHDVGSFVVGSRLGRHHIAPKVSPGKTIEGLAGGTVLTLVVAGVLVALWRPFGDASALELGLIVSVAAPLGDLTESLVKRDLELKDMGSALPGHGGLFDRVDALLFVLPATYALAHLAHLR